MAASEQTLNQGRKKLEDLNIPPTATAWSGANNYHIGDEPSGYVAGPGRAFLAKHLDRRRPVVADFGCWAGRNLPPLLHLAGPDGHVIGVDHPDAAPVLKHTGAKFPAVRLFAAPFTALPLEEAQVSAAICWRVLHNLGSHSELAHVLAELYRVVCPNAPLLIAVRAMSGEEAQPLRLRRNNGSGGWREDFYFGHQALSIFSIAGFDIRHVESIHESEMVDGHLVSNCYWAAHLIRS